MTGHMRLLVLTLAYLAGLLWVVLVVRVIDPDPAPPGVTPTTYSTPCPEGGVSCE